MNIPRIGLAVVLALGLICAAATADAKRTVPRIGFLELVRPPASVSPWREGLLRGLADLGYVEGQPWRL